MKTVTHGISIRGISAAVPDMMVKNINYAKKFSEKEVKMRIKMTGIETRHIAKEGQGAKDLCLCAAQNLLAKMGIDKKEIRILIFVSQTPDFVVPSTAFWLHNQLGLPGDCIAYDINLGCSGFVEGLNTVASTLHSQDIGKKGLLLNGETLSQYIDEEDGATNMIFGDAGTAVLIERTEKENFVCVHSVSSEQYQNIFVESPVHKLIMDGMQVFSYTLRQVTKQIKNLLQKQNNYEFYVLHQAQKYIVDNIASSCNLPKEKVLTSFEEYGNTSGASIPLTICHNKERYKPQNDYPILISGFGAGLSCATASVVLKNPEIMDVMQL